MMGATGGSTQSEADVLKTISDPQAFADRLKVLTTQTTEVQTYLGQAKAAQEAALAERQQAEKLNAATVDLMRQANEKEAEFKAREEWIVQAKAELSTQGDALNQQQAEFTAKVAAAEADIKERQDALYQFEKNLQAMKVQLENEAKQALAYRVTQLENEYQAKASAVAAREADAAAKANKAAATEAAAKAAQLTYEGKLADLKKLVSA